jgi:uncharacterized protein (DUF2147 family)
MHAIVKNNHLFRSDNRSHRAFGPKLKTRVATMTLLWSVAAASPIALAQPLSPGTEPATGLWIDHTGRGAVDIQPCGTKLCGSIAWLQDPMDKRGKPLVDINNPEKTKRARTICGLQILGNIGKQGSNVWDNGWIYDPDEGKTYDLELRLKTPDVLQVTGYIGTKFLSESYVWKRAPASHPRCPPMS